MNVLHRAILYSGDVAVVRAILHAYPALLFDACSADSGGETFTVSRVGNRRIEMPSMAGYTALEMSFAEYSQHYRAWCGDYCLSH